MSSRRPVMPSYWFDQVYALVSSGPVEENTLVKSLTGDKKSKKMAFRALADLRHEGWLTRDYEGLIHADVRVGTLRVNPRGFGFVVAKDYPHDDVFVPKRLLMSATHEDKVRVWVRRTQGTPGPEGRIMEIVERSHQEIVGRLEHGSSGTWRVIPRDPRQPTVLLGRQNRRFHVGLLVSCRITDWPLDPSRPVKGQVIDILGEAGDPGVDIKALMVERKIPRNFPASVLAEAQRLPQGVSEKDWVGRQDLRDTLVVTIDGQDAKDLDDAVSLERTPEGYRVGVHIADVSHYVREGSALDTEARLRGTSVYLVDRVIPMLPERLSNGIASLNPDEPRLTMTAWIDLDANGQRRRVAITKSVIKSRFRLTYDYVNQVLEGQKEAPPDLAGLLTLLDDLRDRLYSIRQTRGAVDFDVPEAKVILDDQGHPIDIQTRNRGRAESIIEELMLLANEAVAGELLRHHLPGLFRVHDEPGTDKMDQFRELIGALGYHLPKTVTPKSLQRLLKDVKGRPEERVINGALLRSMKQARYGPTNTGHFGLASKEYTHFTSPIRRYPDLWVHRVLSAFLLGELTADQRETWQAMVDSIGESSSAREREAMEAERQSVEMKEAQYMLDHVGESYSGVISGVTNFGLFVELPNLIEGLVRIEDLPKDFWAFDSVHYRLSGERTGRVFQLGQPVEVVVASVDAAMARIDFQLQEATPLTPPRAKNRAKRRR